MESLTRMIDQSIQSNDYGTLSTIFSPVAGNGWQTVGQGEKRSLAAYFIQTAVASSTFLPNAFGAMEDVMITALGHLPATVENAADNTLRRKLFEYKINSSDADYVAAARILAGMRMEDDPSSVYYVPAYERLDVFVKIAECFLAEDETTEADGAVNKAGSVVSSMTRNEDDEKKHKALLLRYKSTYARVLDANRKFLQAAQRYHELSQSSPDLVEADELLQMLGRAATCAILAPSGPQRQRVLGLIYKDERLSLLDALDDFKTHSTILKKMYQSQVLRPDELTQFESTLSDHQKAVMGDGLTIMERGVVEHNMTAVSHLYRSIYVTELARILGVNERKAEKIAADMIMDGTIKGSMDQVEGLLEFDLPEPEDLAWDRSITSFCVELNSVTDAIREAVQ